MTSSAAASHCVRLSSGHLMPLLGLGSWQSKGNDAVHSALSSGYRAIDTAYNYLNEAEVGDNIARWVAGGGKREDIFVTSKLPMIGMTSEGVEKFLKKSLERLKLDYLDLYLVHTSFGCIGAHDDDVFPLDESKQLRMDHSTDLIAVWKAMEKAVDAGLTRSIGVSNYSIGQLRKTLAIARIPPAMHQFELHVRYQRPEMIKFCRDNNIAVTSYATLGSPGRGQTTLTTVKMFSLMDDPVVKLVADNHKVTTAQVLVRFWIQQGICAIPKSTNPARIATNGKVLDWGLSPTEFDALKTLDMGEEGQTFLIPAGSSIREHPEFVS